MPHERRAVSVGLALPPEVLRLPRARRAALLALMGAFDLDHVVVGDHVSFGGGQGRDALIDSATILSLTDRLGVYVAVYLLPLRHPVPVARQLATLSELAPGRLIFGVGIGGEDRAEVESCGIDPATRGARMDEYLPSLRRLLLGHPVTFDGTFVTLDDVRIEPTPDPAIKITVGGRSGAALRRAARQGDGWVGIWVTPQRFAESVQEISEQAHAVNRGFVEFEHALSLWCAFDLQGRPRELLARTMEEIYRLSFSTFERYATWGNSAEVADSLVPFLGAGCRTFNLMCPGERFEEAIQGASEVSSILNEILSSTRADWGCHRSGDGY